MTTIWYNNFIRPLNSIQHFRFPNRFLRIRILGFEKRYYSIMDELKQGGQRLAQMPYSNCNTRIVNLRDIDIPESATEEEYARIYHDYIQQSNKNAKALRDAIESIKQGIAPPVAFPTETVYGLGADGTNEPAISGIFAAKGRPSDNPLILHAASVTHIERLSGEKLPEIYRSLVQEFWPGPLTILLPVPKESNFATNVHPGQPTIGWRVPQSKFARFFIAATDRPIAGPSANSSGKPSPTTAQHVLDDLKGKVNFILDGGPCPVGVESTVVDGLHDPPLILRPGGVSQQELIDHGKKFNNKWSATAIGYKRHETNNIAKTQYLEINGTPRAPGMKYRHYAPKGRLILFSPAAVQANRPEAEISRLTQDNPSKPLTIGFLSTTWAPFAGLPIDVPSTSTNNNLYADITTSATYEASSTSPDTKVQLQLHNIQIGPSSTALAQLLFGALRLFDDLGCDYIFAEAPKKVVEGDTTTDQRTLDAVADRLEKAAGTEGVWVD